MFDAAGNLLVADSGFNRIRKISPAGIISTVAGTGSAGYSGDGGQATAAQLQFPLPQLGASGIGVTTHGDVIFTGTGVIRKISTSGIITTIAGVGYSQYLGDGGPATIAGMLPIGLATDSSDNIYVADASGIAYGPDANTGQRIRLIGADGNVNTIAGYPTTANLLGVGAITLAGNSNLYITALDNVSVRLQLDLLKPAGGVFSPRPSVVSYGGPPDFSSQSALLGQASRVTIYGN